MPDVSEGPRKVLAERLLAAPDAAEPYANLSSAAKWLEDQYRWLDAATLWKRAHEAPTTGRNADTDIYAVAHEAMCLSKENTQYGAEEAFKRALAVLDPETLRSTRNQEFLGIVGGIYKRYWDTFRQQGDLEQSLAYYERGWQAGNIADDGYTGINAAYLNDVLAYLEEVNARRGGSVATLASKRREQARIIRTEIVAASLALEARLAAVPDPWWILATLVEAHFGLGAGDSARYDDAENYLKRAMDLPEVAPWMIERTARQLGAIARLQVEAVPSAGGESRPWQVLGLLLVHAPGLRTELGGKVGLALSGGGFRASLFHIGVLARLAELDLLRHVEVISCVSGGSILGAVYYTRLRALLESKRDDEIKPRDYVSLVQKLEADFLDAIQNNNFRMRMLEDAEANWEMLKNKSSRTEALGRAMGQTLLGTIDARMDQVTIQPPDGEVGFRPSDFNWRRMNKVPLLVLNATNQADGHGWHFTPYEMGEPQLSDIDSNPRLRPIPFSDKEQVHVWRAMMASACVPMLFEPIAVPFGDETLHLVDGGVHDNQGTSALVARDCTLLLVSDASGQLKNDASASTSFAAVGLRADEIVQERLRIALYESLNARRRGALLRGMLFMHLRLGLCDEDKDNTSYGIPTGIQRRLSAIRTDLDVFNDAEALSLMLSGYRMTDDQLTAQLPSIKGKTASEGAWKFGQIDPLVTANPSSPALIALLDLGSSRFLKAWRAVPFLKRLGQLLIVVAAIAAIGGLLLLLRSDAVISVSSLAWSAVTALVAFLIARYLHVKVPSWKQEVTLVAIAFGGAGLARIHKRWIDPAYIAAGRVDRLGGKP